MTPAVHNPPPLPARAARARARVQATVWCAELAGQKLAKWGYLRYEGNQRGAAPLLSGRSKPLATPDACAFEVHDFFGSGACACFHTPRALWASNEARALLQPSTAASAFAT